MLKFPKKEIYVTQTFKLGKTVFLPPMVLFLPKLIFVEWQKGNDQHARNHVIFAIIITFEVKITTFEIKMTTFEVKMITFEVK